MLSSIYSVVTACSRLADTAGIGALGCAMVFSMPVLADAGASTDGAGITYQAVIEKHFKHSEQSISRAQLFYNEHAYRLVPLSEGNDFELIVNTDNDTVSIIDRKRKIITDIDLALEVSLSPQLITLSQIRRLVKLPGQLDATPCLLNGGHKTGLHIIEGVEEEVWSCNKQSDAALSGFHDQVNKQHYSVKQGRVVYSQYSEGFEYHLRDIQPVKSEALFAKPEDFRMASLEDFFAMVKPISAYTSSTSSQQIDNVAKLQP